MDINDHKDLLINFEKLFQDYTQCNWHGDLPVPDPVIKWLCISKLLLDYYRQLILEIPNA